MTSLEWSVENDVMLKSHVVFAFFPCQNCVNLGVVDAMPFLAPAREKTILLVINHNRCHFTSFSYCDEFTILAFHNRQTYK